MKTKLLLVAFLLTKVVCSQVVFQKSYGVFPDQRGSALVQTSDGYVLTGTKGLSNQVILMKTNFFGDTLWAKIFNDSTSDEKVNSIKQTFDKGFIITGYRWMQNRNKYDCCLIKTDSLGNLQWSKLYGGNDSFEEGVEVQQVSDSGYIVAGNTDVLPGEGDVFLMKTNSRGDTLWIKRYGTELSGRYNLEKVNSMYPTSDGGYILGCLRQDYNGGDYTTALLIKTDSVGNVLWSKICKGLFYAQFIKQTRDKGYIFSDGATTGIVQKTDSIGDVIWTRYFPYTNCYLAETSNGFTMIAGFYFIRTDSNGDTTHVSVFNGSVFQSVIQQTPDSGFIIAGNIGDTSTNVVRIVLIKTDSLGNDGCNVPIDNRFFTGPLAMQSFPRNVTVETYSPDLITPTTTVKDLKLNILQCSLTGVEEKSFANSFTIYPNPSAGLINISISQEIKNGTLNIYNVIGEKVFSGSFTGKSKTVNCKWNSGLYFVEMDEGVGKRMEKVLVE